MQLTSRVPQPLCIKRDLEMFESVLLGNTQTAAGAAHGISPSNVNWLCKRVFDMVTTSGLRDPMMASPSEYAFGWRILRRNVPYWQGQVNYLKRHFGVTYDAPIVRPVIATRFKTMRNVHIFERVVNGEKCLTIAKDHEVTVASILQIWKLVARYCRETAVLNGLAPPPIPSLYAVRINKELWLSYLEMFKKTLEGK